MPTGTKSRWSTPATWPRCCGTAAAKSSQSAEEETGLPLGVDADFKYQSYTRELAPGDFLALFTDGISEAMNTSGELYGLDRLRTQLAADSPRVSELGRLILDDVKRFVGGRPQSDDMCLACFGRTLK